MADAAHTSGKLNVFISYSRKDLDFADQLAAALELLDISVSMDRTSIPGGEVWEQQLTALIRDAVTVVFVLSPDSAISRNCAWEVDRAANKRIVPVVWRPLEGVAPPKALTDRNYIYFCATPAAPGSGFGAGLVKLVAALNTDLDWLREHTRLLQRATEWDAGGRLANRLLSGGDVAAARIWAARRPKEAPEPTALHLDFIRASEDEEEARSDAQRQRLEVMAAAQAQRETALRAREAAEKRTAGLRRVLSITFGTAFLGVSSFAGWALWESAIAARESAVAQLQEARAEAEKVRAENLTAVALTVVTSASNLIATAVIRGQFDKEEYKDALNVFEKGANDLGDSDAMTNLGGFYYNGYGVPQDYAKARDWFEKAAALGNGIAMRNLGVLYESAQGVTQDYVTAREWYQKAAAKCETRAMTSLGGLYESGHGVPQDFAKAREWYQKAAAPCNADAKLKVAN